MTGKLQNCSKKLSLKIVAGEPENGAVLVTTLIILVLLTVIGVSGINMATTDIQITRNYREMIQQLYYCDGHVNQFLADTSSWLNSTSNILNNPTATYSFARDFDSDGEDETNTIVTGITASPTDGLPDMQHNSTPPIGSGYGSNHFEIRRYAIVANSTDSATTVESGCYKIFPKY